MRKLTYLALFSSLLLFQSCFEIIEQVFIKNDGTGNFQLVINMSKSKTKLNSIMKMKKVNGHDVPGKEEIQGKVAEIESVVKKTPGISSVTTKLDFENYIATLTCNFSNITNINAAIKNVGEKENARDKALDKMFDYDAASKTFSRLNRFAMKDGYQKMSNADREIFATANYTSIFRFESDVSATSNKESKVAASKKAVMLKLNALDIMTNKKSIENKINLVK